MLIYSFSCDPRNIWCTEVGDHMTWWSCSCYNCGCNTPIFCYLISKRKSNNYKHSNCPLTPPDLLFVFICGCLLFICDSLCVECFVRLIVICGACCLPHASRCTESCFLFYSRVWLSCLFLTAVGFMFFCFFPSRCISGTTLSLCFLCAYMLYCKAPLALTYWEDVDWLLISCEVRVCFCLSARDRPSRAVWTAQWSDDCRSHVVCPRRDPHKSLRN